MKIPIEQALQHAVEAHKAGNLQEAERLYRTILQTQPKHPDVNHNLGVLAVSVNKTAAALPLFKTALEANPIQRQFWLSYIDALIREKQFDNARFLLQQGKKAGLAGERVDALELQIAQFDDDFLGDEPKTNKLSIAIELREVGKYQEAQEYLNHFLNTDQSNAEGWSLLSQVFLLDNRDMDAEKALVKAISINPNLSSVYRNQARLLLKKSKPTEALEKAKIAFDQLNEDSESLLVLAACLVANLKDQEALPLIERVLKAKPNYAEAFANRAMILLRANNITKGIDDLETALSLKPHLVQLWGLLGSLRYQSNNLSGAIEALKKANALEPTNVSYMVDLGELLRQDNQVVEAISVLEGASKLAPEKANVWTNLGVALQQDGRIDDAKLAYQKSLAIHPNSAEISNNLGAIAKETGDWESALQYFEQVITLKPDFAEAHNNLGVTLKELGRIEEAETSYRKAIDISPNLAAAHNNLGRALLELGRLEEALRAVINSIGINPTVDAKLLFVEITKKTYVKTWDQSMVQLVSNALLEPWGRPSDTIQFACRLLKIDKEFLQTLKQSKYIADQASYELSFLSSFLKKEFNALSLLLVMLSSSPIPDHEIELLLTLLRYQLLNLSQSDAMEEAYTKDMAPLYCSLAQQCFINEYVYFQTAEEINHSHQLQDRLIRVLNGGGSVSEYLVIAVACYFPLYSIEGAEKLLNKKWSDDVNCVLRQQIKEPLEEIKMYSSIQVLTSIDNQVSLAVQSQYQENPYPRWVSLPKKLSKKLLNSYIQSKFPLSAFKRLADDRNPEILIAGCGTGQHPINTSQTIKGAKILAVDLSMTSLAYAKRKTAELRIHNVDYAQADLLKLASLDLTFDVIESSGVLHHLENPFVGWEVLLSLLRPNGLMRLGLYSEVARRDIKRVRNLISNVGIGSSFQEIRDYRKYFLDLRDFEDYGFAFSNSDFFSTSACRDLLFHVQEQYMTLKILADFFKDHNLTFLGFEIDSSVIRSYKNRFPNDLSATNLDQWQIYEEENPNTFISMYQFWIQKNN